MIGVCLRERREEFLEYVKRHPVEFEEIVSIYDLTAPNRYKIILIEGPATLAGPFCVIDVRQMPFEDILSNYTTINSEVEPIVSNIFGRALDAYQDESRVAAAIKPGFRLVDEHAVGMQAQVEEPAPTKVDYQKVTVTAEETEIFEEESFSLHEPAQAQPVYEAKSTVFSTLAVDSGQPRSSKRMAIRGRTTPKTHSRSSDRAKNLGSKIITFSSLTDKAGVTTVAYMLAKSLALDGTFGKILYLDLNISNPNTILNLMHLNPGTDAAVVKIGQVENLDLASNISLLTETIAVGDSSFSIITFGEADLRLKSQLLAADFKNFLLTLSDCFDIVLVDIGKLQLTMQYQLNLLRSDVARHFMVADASSSRLVNSFVRDFKVLQINFDLVINKYMPNTGTFVINQQLGLAPIGTINNHRNINAVITDHVPLEGTPLYDQFKAIGGVI